ncbi:MAG: DUF924 domain-containing protein [Candidatus Protochlamydia sp.]|nr:DUF924 domain-containing protein [Candidatus Protochlamydia sp.]
MNSKALYFTSLILFNASNPLIAQPAPEKKVLDSKDAQPAAEKTVPVDIEALNPSKRVGSSKIVPERAQEVLNFWFGELADEENFPTDKVGLWVGGPETYRGISDQFLQDFQQAIVGGLNDWRQTPRGRLALILLLDQFPRHLYPHSPQALASDSMARGLVLEGLQRGDDTKLFPVERAFFYLPLERVEEIKFQDLSVEYFKNLVEESPASIKPQMQKFLDFAILNREIISKFGRFPYRNAILRRESTPEEQVYLYQMGGQN